MRFDYGTWLSSLEEIKEEPLWKFLEGSKFGERFLALPIGTADQRERAIELLIAMHGEEIGVQDFFIYLRLAELVEERTMNRPSIALSAITKLKSIGQRDEVLTALGPGLAAHLSTWELKASWSKLTTYEVTSSVIRAEVEFI